MIIYRFEADRPLSVSYVTVCYSMSFKWMNLIQFVSFQHKLDVNILKEKKIYNVNFRIIIMFEGYFITWLKGVSLDTKNIVNSWKQTIKLVHKFWNFK